MRIVLRTIVSLAVMASLAFPAYAQDISPECVTDPTEVNLSYDDSNSRSPLNPSHPPDFSFGLS
jgi:hypothetical protein